MPFPTSNSALQSNDSQSTNVLLANGSVDPERAVTELRLQDGRVVRLSTAALLATGQDAYADSAEVSHQREHTAADGEVLPIVEEHLVVGRRTVETGKLRLRKVVQEYETELDETLAVRSFDVERVVLNQPVDTPPAVRQEGDTTIYPLIEERLIVTRQLVVKEELRVTKRDTERQDNRPVTLRREVVEIEREPLTDVDSKVAATRF